MRAAVHPHGRGEHVRKPPPNDPAFGSSPRAWGTHTVLVASSAGNRFIPTGVGNTAKGYVLPAQRAVHPHGRGEHTWITEAIICTGGSSPRAWGTPTNSPAMPSRRRFIPTGVGNTRPTCGRGRDATVHPHGRGEHETAWLGDCIEAGSSPRAWGTLDQQPRVMHPHRFIPTGVGNTNTHRARQRFRPVHPHGRGEHAMHRVAHGLLHGSSPRAWGTHSPMRWRRDDDRFIPTGVGNTRSGSQARRQDPVHPHGRGEHIDMPVPRPSAYGSSPRAWGTLRVECSASQQPRFIPTGVGNTGSPSPRNPKTPVHPHGRGEHAVGKAEAAAAHRFIPTGVGNTSLPG